MPEDLDSQILLELVAAGDDDAATAVYERYLPQLIRLAQQRLSSRLNQRVDADDVVQSAYRSFFIRAQQGEFALRRSGDLWRLLAAITVKKVYRNVERHTAERRDMSRETRIPADALNEVASTREPTAPIVAEIIDQVEVFMRRCDVQTRRVVELRLRGETVPEIAAEIGRSQRTVRRLLGDVRKSLDHAFKSGGSRHE